MAAGVCAALRADDIILSNHRGHGHLLAKGSDPVSGSSVDPGDQIVYTLKATNTSDAVVEGAQAVDDLSKVLDNATIDVRTDEGRSILVVRRPKAAVRATG